MSRFVSHLLLTAAVCVQPVAALKVTAPSRLTGFLAKLPKLPLTQSKTNKSEPPVLVFASSQELTDDQKRHAAEKVTNAIDVARANVIQGVGAMLSWICFVIFGFFLTLGSAMSGKGSDFREAAPVILCALTAVAMASLVCIAYRWRGVADWLRKKVASLREKWEKNTACDRWSMLAGLLLVPLITCCLSDPKVPLLIVAACAGVMVFARVKGHSEAETSVRLLLLLGLAMLCLLLATCFTSMYHLKEGGKPYSSIGARVLATTLDPFSPLFLAWIGFMALFAVTYAALHKLSPDTEQNKPLLGQK